MGRISTVVLASLFLGYIAQAAWATSGAHFFSATSSIDGNGALVVTFDEAGVGQQLVNYTLGSTANPIQASATYACINGGGNHPSAANKEDLNGPLGTTNFSAEPRNGRVKASTPPTGPLSAGSFSCPGGQKLVLARVSYANITLTDTSNSVTTGVTPDPICRSFSVLFPCP